jgi:hypothetical protein
MLDSIIATLNVVFVLAALWTFATYLWLPHDLRRAFQNGESVTPAQEGGALIWAGVGATDFGCWALAGRIGLWRELERPVAGTLLVAGCLLAAAGLVRGWVWYHRVDSLRSGQHAPEPVWATYRGIVQRVSKGGAFEDLRGSIPTREVARQVVHDGRGQVLAPAASDAPRDPLPYPHIDYITATGAAGTIRILEH